MTALFEELGYSVTPMGELTLRRRQKPASDENIYEIKLNGEFLMSSQFTVAEEQLAHLGLAEIDFPEAEIIVGGLGLGYTAAAALESKKVKSMLVVDALEEIIEWHREKLLPLGKKLTDDPRCRFVKGDFFAMAKEGGFDPDIPERRFHAILLDVDHSPRMTLNPSHNWLYEKDGLKRLLDYLHPGGVFGLWSNDPPDDDFCETLRAVFPGVSAHVVSFYNPLQNREATNTIYVAKTAL